MSEPQPDQAITQRSAADAPNNAPTADQQPTTPAPQPDAATDTTSRDRTTIEPADQQ